MPRLDADADPDRWVPVTESFGLRGRRARKRAIGMLLGQATTAMGGAPRPGGRFAAWAASQAVPALMRRAGGRVRAWMWKADPELIVVLAQLQELTPQLRTARAMMPMEYDDTEDFRSPYLGTGEKLVMTMPPDPRTPPFVSYTWDTGTHLVTLSAVCSDRERVGTLLGDLDHLARSLRVVDDLTLDDGGFGSGGFDGGGFGGPSGGGPSGGGPSGGGPSGGGPSGGDGFGGGSGDVLRLPPA